MGCWRPRTESNKVEVYARRARPSPGSTIFLALWAAADDSGRRLLTEAFFETVEVLGVQSVTIHPTPEADAHGWSDAFGTLPLLLDAGRAFSTDGRGERDSPATNDLPVTMRLAEPPVPLELVRSA